VELHKIRLLGLPPEQEALILGGNALRLIGAAKVGNAAARVPRPSRRRFAGTPGGSTVATAAEPGSEAGMVANFARGEEASIPYVD
jgi:hypothetical protein